MLGRCRGNLECICNLILGMVRVMEDQVAMVGNSNHAQLVSRNFEKILLPKFKLNKQYCSLIDA